MHILKQLKTKKGRDETGLFVVEGATFVGEIPQGWEVVRYIFSHTFRTQHPAETARYASLAPSEVLPDGKFASYSDTVTPQGIAAVCRQKTYHIHTIMTQTDHAKDFFLMGENVQDPGNVGTLIRTAAAAGAGAVFLTAGSADPYSPKVLRAAAGAVLRIPVLYATPEEIKNAAIPLYAAHPRGNVTPYELDMKKSFCLLIGNEAHGLSAEALAMADAHVRLPMAAHTESLNAAMAAGILLYEAVRQRC
jgi:TrmH family RNA methyltransferase